MRQMWKMFVFGLVVSVALFAPARGAFAWPVQLVSANSEGVQANRASDYPAVSADGHFVVFASNASNLLDPLDPYAGATLTTNIFLRNLQLGTTELVSIGLLGEPANAPCGEPDVSGDGRFIVFESTATNLVAGDTNGTKDIFVRDRLARVTTRVSVASDGSQSKGNNHYAKISADGHLVSFLSYDNNLVADDHHPYGDIFVHDRLTGQTERVSTIADGTTSNGSNFWYPTLSADGTVVAYEMYLPGDQYRDIAIYDRKDGSYTFIQAPGNVSVNGDCRTPALNADGRYVAFSSSATNLMSTDTNGVIDDIYVFDRVSGNLERVNLNISGQQAVLQSAVPAITADGNVVVYFSSDGTLLEGGYPSSYLNGPVYAFNRSTRTVELVSEDVTHASMGLSVSADGAVVSFVSMNANLLLNDLNGTFDVFAAINPVVVKPQLVEVIATPNLITQTRGGLVAVEVLVDAPDGANVVVTIDDEYGTYSATHYGDKSIVLLESYLGKHDKDGRIYTINATVEGPNGFYRTGSTQVLVQKAKPGRKVGG